MSESLKRPKKMDVSEPYIRDTIYFVEYMKKRNKKTRISKHRQEFSLSDD